MAQQIFNSPSTRLYAFRPIFAFLIADNIFKSFFHPYPITLIEILQIQAFCKTVDGRGEFSLLLIEPIH